MIKKLYYDSLEKVRQVNVGQEDCRVGQRQMEKRGENDEAVLSEIFDFRDIVERINLERSTGQVQLVPRSLIDLRHLGMVLIQIIRADRKSVV